MSLSSGLVLINLFRAKAPARIDFLRPGLKTGVIQNKKSNFHQVRIIVMNRIFSTTNRKLKKE